MIGIMLLYEIIVSCLSNRLESKFGSLTLVTIMAQSTLLTLGLINSFFLFSNKQQFHFLHPQDKRLECVNQILCKIFLAP